MIEEPRPAPGVWLPVGNGFELMFRYPDLGMDSKDAGHVSRSYVPSPAARTPLGRRLRRLHEDLLEHRWACWDTVTAWMCGGYALPVRLLAALWPDALWREMLYGAYVTGDDGDGGFLREAAADGAVLTGLDGKDMRPGWQSLVIAHPVHLTGHEEMHERGQRLGLRQRLIQLRRDLYAKPADVRGNAVSAYAGRRVRKLPTFWGGTESIGGYAVQDLVSGGEPVQARFWVGAGRTGETTRAGDLVWVGTGERILPLAEVDDVAWSEGIRMAEHVCGQMRVRPEATDDAVGRPWTPPAPPRTLPGRTAQLEAGLLPPMALEGVAVRARAYTHPMLGHEPTIRLVDDATASATDTLQAAIGFGAPTTGEPLARGVAADPGYPVWAVLRDPGRAAVALAARDDLRQVTQSARFARQQPRAFRPAAVTAEFDRVAAGLPAEHLPAFWEWAGRICLVAHSTVQAAKLFGRALAAERAHPGVWEAELKHAAFRRFALAGAVPATALAAHGRELKRAADPVAAHKEFAELLSLFMAGGRPPTPVLLTLLKALAEPAKADGVDAILETLLWQPVARHVPAEVWQRLAPEVAALAERSPHLADALRPLVPPRRS
ncbi:DUF4132 domain-containing protein [Nonomuraea sp. NPDC046802]|uniref:DUF4132 domain-containing protein n=1 Tax=Nonomuraea sp. NPDC046802 TaxID=3154919 RepID=UPI0033D39488